jgi:hypothetical protein
VHLGTFATAVPSSLHQPRDSMLWIRFCTALDNYRPSVVSVEPSQLAKSTINFEVIVPADCQPPCLYALVRFQFHKFHDSLSKRHTRMTPHRKDGEGLACKNNLGRLNRVFFGSDFFGQAARYRATVRKGILRELFGQFLISLLCILNSQCSTTSLGHLGPRTRHRLESLAT